MPFRRPLYHHLLSYALANKPGLDWGKSAAKDIKYAQETVDAWVDGMTTAISNAQKRKAQARQKQETVAQQQVKEKKVAKKPLPTNPVADPKNIIKADTNYADMLQEHGQELSAMKPVATISTTAEFSKENQPMWDKQLVSEFKDSGLIVERKGVGKIGFRESSVENIAYHLDDKIKYNNALVALRSAKEVLKDGIEVGRSRARNVYGVESDMITYAAPVIFNGTRMNVAVSIADMSEYKDGTIYCHNITLENGAEYNLSAAFNRKVKKTQYEKDIEWYKNQKAKNEQRRQQEVAQNQQTETKVSYSLNETTDGRYVAVVDDDILSHIDTTHWNKSKRKMAVKAAKEALKNFKDGIVVNGIKRKVNNTTRQEYTKSTYSNELYKSNKAVFADKMRAAAIADDVIVATVGWKFDGKLKHERNDNFVDFEHGTTLIKSGEAKYSADVSVGITNKGERVLYDITDIVPADFELTKENPPMVTTQEAIDHITEDSFDKSLADSTQNVKKNFSLNDSTGRELSEAQQEYFEDSEVRDGKWRLLPVYHATDADFTVFKREHLGEMTDGIASSEYMAATAHLGFWFNTKDVSKHMWTDPSKTKEVYLNIENPYRTSVLSLAAEMEAEYGDADMTSAEMGEAYRDELIRQGYDGIIATDEEFGGTSYVIFDSNQAKNTDNLNPTSNPDIRYATDDLGLDEFRKPITMQDVEVLRSIGRKSVNSFTSADLQKAGKWAYKFYQELGVKSPFFRAWFGDWRAKDTITNVNIADASTSSNKTAGKTLNPDTKMTISWSTDLHGETKMHSKKGGVSVLAVNDIEQIIQKAVYLETVVSQPDSKSKLAGTAFMHSFYSLYRNQEGINLIKMYVEQAVSNKGNTVFERAYQLKDIKKIATIPSGVLPKNEGLTGGTAASYTVADLYALVKQYDKDFTAAKEVSSVLLDAEGKPEKVYHGTAANFTVFERGDIGYHVGTKAQAEDRIAGVKGGHIMELYARIKNPLYAAMDFGDWHGQNVAEMRIETEQFEDFDNRAEIEERLSEIAQMDNQQEADTALRKYLQDLGYDGIVYENRWEGEGESYIVFESSQLKSATDNIGLFDRNNPDIRYALDKDFLRETVNAIDTEGLERIAEVVSVWRGRRVRLANPLGGNGLCP